LSDPTKSVAKAYGVLAPGEEYAQRWTFIIGVDGKILDVIKNVSAGHHGHDLAVRLGELGVARRK
jgi:thioredoxin-dependent peroxiredoxin